MITLQNISKHGVEEIKLIQEVAKNYPQIEAIYLFGSCAKGTDTENSDIDTLIIWNNFEDYKSEGLNMASFVETIFLKKAFEWDRLFLNSVDELEKKDYGVYTSIKELNCVIYKKEI